MRDRVRSASVEIEERDDVTDGSFVVRDTWNNAVLFAPADR